MIEVTDSYNREVTLLSKLKHSSLPHVHDHFTDPHHWYIVMDYIKGETLEEYVQKLPGKKMSLNKVLAIAIDISGILHYLHKRKPAIIFRDVKPANIMRKRNGRLYLIDFGIARRFTPGQVKDTGPLGSPGYAAPEQYGNRASTTTRTDMYGLAATMQTLLTGEDPTIIATTNSFDGLSAVVASAKIPPELQELLTQMLSRDPEKRPRDMLRIRQRLMLIKEGWLGLTLKYILSFLYGLLIGSLPYSVFLLLNFLPVLLHLIFQTPYYYSDNFALHILTNAVLCTWPFLFITQTIIGCQRLIAGQKPYQRIFGAGICLMLVGLIALKIYLAHLNIGYYYDSAFPLFPPF